VAKIEPVGGYVCGRVCLAWKCLERWNAAVSVDEGTNITSANQRSSGHMEKQETEFGLGNRKRKSETESRKKRAQ